MCTTWAGTWVKDDGFFLSVAFSREEQSFQPYVTVQKFWSAQQSAIWMQNKEVKKQNIVAIGLHNPTERILCVKMR